jgi:type II pantothenate kinase
VRRSQYSVTEGKAAAKASRTASMSPLLDPLNTGESGTTLSELSISTVPETTRPRRPTVQSDFQIQDTILRPGTVRINVQGAFIVDEEPLTPRSNDYDHDTRDIRLPNHTSVVSHVAVDVSYVMSTRHGRVDADHANP